MSTRMSSTSTEAGSATEAKMEVKVYAASIAVNEVNKQVRVRYEDVLKVDGTA